MASPSLWLIGGLDPTGGAGLLRDEWAARAMLARGPRVAVRVAAIATMLTRQGHGPPAQASAVAPDTLARRLRAVPDGAVVKLGAFHSDHAPALEQLARRAVLVLDPVQRASDGGGIGAPAQALVRLARCAALITPNWHEASALARALSGSQPAPHDTGSSEVGGAVRLAQLLQRGTHAAVLLKGGHGPRSNRSRTRLSSPDTDARDGDAHVDDRHHARVRHATVQDAADDGDAHDGGPQDLAHDDTTRDDTARDVFVGHGVVRTLEHPWDARGDVRGTGCALASAIAAAVARDRDSAPWQDRVAGNLPPSTSASVAPSARRRPDDAAWERAVVEASGWLQAQRRAARGRDGASHDAVRHMTLCVT